VLPRPLLLKALLRGPLLRGPGWRRPLRGASVGAGRRVDPVERVAADLRRLSAVYADRERSNVVRVGARLAYTDRLRDACAQLEVAHRLDELRGSWRSLEVERCQRELTRRGLVLAP